MQLTSKNEMVLRKVQNGFALIVTLLLLLVLMIMAAGIAYIGSNYVDLSNAVSYKPQSINAAETCVEQAKEWLNTDAGIKWYANANIEASYPNPLRDPSNIQINVKDLVLDPLYQHNLLLDTVSGPSDQRRSDFKSMLNKAQIKSCTLKKIIAPTNIRCAWGIPKSHGVEIVATGNFNVQYNSDKIDGKYWRSNSNETELIVQLNQNEC